MKKLYLLLLLSSSFCVQQTHADNFINGVNLNSSQLRRYNDLQAILDNYMNNDARKDNVSGIPLTVQCSNINKGFPITLTSGKISIDGGALPKDALFQIGSSSKSFTSVVLLQLEAEGFLGKKGLNSTVGDYLPEYTKWKDVTIKQLLNMTSGIPDYMTDDNTILDLFNSYPFNDSPDPKKQINTKNILDAVKDKDLIFTPSTNYHYSNTGYVLAGKIVEKVTTSHSLQNEIQKRIIDPLNLQYTHYVSNLPKNAVPSEQVNLLMSGYFYENNTFPALKSPYFNAGQDIRDYSLSVLNAAGAIISNTKDINIYVHEIFKPKERGGKILSEEQINKELLSLVSNATGQPIDQVDAKNPVGYGLGIGASYEPNSGLTIYYYNGAPFGFKSSWIYTPKNEIFAFTAGNSTNENTPNDYSNDVMSPVFNLCLKNSN